MNNLGPIAWEIQSHNANSDKKPFSQHPPFNAFCSLSWMNAGIGMISQQDIFNPEMVFTTSWKIILELYGFAYSNFLHMHSVHFNSARTKNSRE